VNGPAADLPRARGPCADDLVLCPLAAIPDPGSRGFRLPRREGLRDSFLEIFVVRRGHGVHGYVNRCPHNGTTLDWMPDRFLDRDGKVIVCGTHGAVFRIDDGECIDGPCAGARLHPVPVRVRRGQVVVARSVLAAI